MIKVKKKILFQFQLGMKGTSNTEKNIVINDQKCPEIFYQKL